MKTIKSLKLMGLLSAFTLAVGCAGPAENPEETTKQPEKPAEQAPAAQSGAEDTNAAVAGSGSMSDSYEVAKGDSLWGISGKDAVYGNPYQWPLIYKANSDKIKDADLIYPGQVLGIDTNPSDADKAAAIQHAKTRGSWSIGVTEESDKAYLAQ